MKSFFSILAATLLFNFAAPTARAEVDISVDFFHENLAPYGDWVDVEDYGYCWQPRDVDADWRPYSDGRWVYTDAGWTWDSDEPYSWAVYHYGRWARIDEVGWVWVPGTEWGPGWVSWRRGSRHVGWAPLPPEARFVRSSGLSVQVDVDFDIGPTNYNFVEVRNFGAPRLRSVFIEPRENITIINQTSNITNITYVNSVVYNGGPQYDVISRESAQPIRRLKLDRRERFDGGVRSARAEQLRSRVDGDTLRVSAPAFNQQVATAPPKVARKVEKGRVNRGWKNAGAPEEVEKVRNKIKREPVAAAATPAPGPNPGKDAKPSVFAPETTEKLIKDETGNVGHKPQDQPVPVRPDATRAPNPDKTTEPGKPGRKDRVEEKRKSEKPVPVPFEASPSAIQEKQQEPPNKKGRRNNQRGQGVVKDPSAAKQPVEQKAPVEQSAPAPAVERAPAKEKAPVEVRPDAEQKTSKRKADNGNAASPRKQPPAARENEPPKPQAVNREARPEPPKSQERAVRNIDRGADRKQEAPPEARKPEVRQPANAEAKPAQQEKPKGKNKGRKTKEEEAAQ